MPFCENHVAAPLFLAVHCSPKWPIMKNGFTQMETLSGIMFYEETFKISQRKLDNEAIQGVPFGSEICIWYYCLPISGIYKDYSDSIKL